jgi:hypothetical protein
MDPFEEGESEKELVEGLYQMGDEILEEVVFAEGDEPPTEDDDSSTVWTDADDEVIEMDELDGGNEDRPPVIDLAACTFSAHSDSVYCSAIHPTNSIAITGTSFYSSEKKHVFSETSK